MSTRFRALVVALAIVGCRDGPTAPSTPIEMFDAFWTTYDREYSYFAYKGINWDSLRTEFRPRAIAAESEEALIPILKQMVAPLRDLHAWFVRPDGRVDMTYASNAVVNWDAFVWTRLTDTCDLVYAKPELGSARPMSSIAARVSRRRT